MLFYFEMIETKNPYHIRIASTSVCSVDFFTDMCKTEFFSDREAQDVVRVILTGLRKKRGS